ncbi:hypothetical protein [Flavobacterium sp. M31R6]|uniref:hypothetical protein n=1 Tax=Flavobacterium sp. M31R6 TaxID=2739062 RepID=UPI0015694E65|nr:hypothetical protein [Flavobacterium sp. M31R6]QKJ63891.1 hypothetical protein HQN62_12395 [Flavobacterium sp. M31R6]
MKKTIVLLILIITTSNILAQVQDKKNSSNGSREKKQNNPTAIYQLFPTQNRWTFIKLNTRNGQMWQVQYGLEDGNNFETNLNSVSLVTEEKEIDGRFTLYPTQNIWNFILLDQVDGYTWQVQWSTEATSRLVIPIH